MSGGVQGAWWLSQSSKLLRPDDVGLGGFDSHALPPAPHQAARRGRAHRVRWTEWAFVLLAVTLGAASPARAQGRDTTVRAVAIPRTVTDTSLADTTRGPRPALKPPLSPGRAFLYSFVLPGYSQTVLGRPKASALFIAFEAVCVTMLRQAQFDLRQARNAGADSVVTSYWNPATGQKIRTVAPSPYNSQLIRSREAHVEDWIAVLVTNHLMSGLEAYVSANLWDVPAELAVHPTASGANVGIQLRVP